MRRIRKYRVSGAVEREEKEWKRMVALQSGWMLPIREEGDIRKMILERIGEAATLAGLPGVGGRRKRSMVELLFCMLRSGR